MPVKPSPSCAAVLSGAGGASCCVQRVVLDRALAVVDRLEELAQRLGEPRRVFGQLAQLGDLLGGLGQRLLPDDGRLAERARRAARCVREGLERLRAGGGSPGAAACIRRRNGICSVAVASSCASVGRSSPRKRRQLVPLRLELVGARGLDLGGLHRLLRPARELLLLRLDRGADLCRRR